MYESVSGLKSSPIKNNLSIKMIFVGTEEVHYLKSELISKIDFVQTKEKGYNPVLLLPEKEVYVGTVVVSNSVSKEFGVKETRSSSTLLAKALAKTDVVRKTFVASKKKWLRALRCQAY